MSVESAADRAGFFIDTEFAEPAEYLAPASGAVAVDCTIIFDRGQAKNRWKSGEMAVAAAERKAWINGDELAQPVRDGRLTVGSEVLKIVGNPILDETGKLWSVDLVLVN